MKKEVCNLDEAIALLARRTGKTRRQAKLFLLNALANDKLRGFTLDPETGEREIVPARSWPKVQ